MVGQLKGPFYANDNQLTKILDYTNNQVLKVGIYHNIPDRIQKFRLNDSIILLPSEGIYEMDSWSYISKLIFLQDMNEDTYITYVSKENM